jgi:Zn ribbon nucleic-acid-binding protein
MAEDKIYIDVLTLDSVQCAACGYMMESIAALPKDVQDMIEYKEWSIKNKSSVAKFIELKGKVLPTICIKSDLVFESIIPQYEELIDEMAKRAPNEAMKDRILSLRDKGFEFDKIEENLKKAGSGLATRVDSQRE